MREREERAWEKERNSKSERKREREREIKSRFSEYDFRNMGLNLIFWVLNLLGLCFVDLVLAGF